MFENPAPNCVKSSRATR